MVNDGVRFAKDGPSIPVQLLQTLEDGGLTIFAGARVSRRCGLPDFPGLVKEVCDRLGRPMLTDEREVFDRGSFDAAFGLIENRIEKRLFRRAAGEVLRIKEGADRATHEALLKLATSKQKRLRLVTTTFDRAFELAPFSGKRAFDYASFLPLPGVH
jgi:NAD-dependent SIR2 family protein deacetylase